MIILRVDFKNGLHLEFGWATLEPAIAVRDRLMPDEWESSPVLLKIHDECGRHCIINRTDVVHVMAVDIELEQRELGYVSRLIQAAQKEGTDRFRPSPQIVSGRMAVLSPNAALASSTALNNGGTRR